MFLQSFETYLKVSILSTTEWVFRLFDNYCIAMLYCWTHIISSFCFRVSQNIFIILNNCNFLHCEKGQVVTLENWYLKTSESSHMAAIVFPKYNEFITFRNILHRCFSQLLFQDLPFLVLSNTQKIRWAGKKAREQICTNHWYNPVLNSLSK